MDVATTRTVAAAALLFLWLPADSRAQDSSPSFEVASVKMSAGSGHPSVKGGPGTADPEHVYYTHYPMKGLLLDAFGIAPAELTAPGWVDTERYDVHAKLPPRTTKPQFRLMLRELLTERFRIVSHAETRSVPIYRLTIAKNGSNLRVAKPDDPSGEDAPPKPGLGSDGFPQIQGPVGQPQMFKMFGKTRLSIRGESLDDFADILTLESGRTVVNATGLNGLFDIVVYYVQERVPLIPRMPEGSPDPDERQGPSLQTALQEQLGLKLETSKGLVGFLTIDRMEKVPVEN